MLKDFGGFDNLLSYKIFLERYASKDNNKENIKIGDLVVCLINPKEGAGNRELGVINNIKNNEVEVKLLTGFEIVQGKSKSLIDTLRTFNINLVDKLKETHAQEMHNRIAHAVAIKTELQSTDENDTIERYEKYYKKVLQNWKFIPAGRMLIGLGYNETLSLFNCYLIPSPKDSRKGINDTLGYMTELMSRGGGVGINLSSLRPRGANVVGVCGRSSGAISWGDEYSRRTGRVEQGGCVIGSTLIATEKGNISIKELVNTEPKPWVFTYNLENKKIELKQAKWVGKTGTQKEVWKLTTDKNLILYATPDHKILLRTGEYKELKDIKIGQLFNNNHKVISIKYSHEEDVYDLEVPTTHNFAVVQDKEDIASSGIFIHNSRRGALILMLNDWHPDLLELIEAKQQSQKMKQVLQQLSDEERKSLKVPLENCNISIGVSDSFMQAVADDTDWNLEFPDTTTENYTDIWDGDLQAWKEKGYKTIIYKTLKARELWHTITESSWQSGEPGIVFLERYNKLSNSSYYPEGRIVGVNPCGEQGLSAHAACDLGHLNLPKFLKNSFIDFNYIVNEEERVKKIIDEGINWSELQKTIKAAIRFLDNIYNIAHFVKEEQEYVVRGERRIGLGTLGLAEMLIRLGITYGNNEVCLTFLDYLYKFIQLCAYKTSIELAKNLKPFPFCNKEKHSNLYMVQKLGLQKEVKEHGIRNVTLTTQAPTGTVGTMLNTSTGIEPFPFFEWVRKSNIGEHKDYAKVVVEWKEKNPNKKLPKFFVSAMGPNAISPEDHAAVQTTIQQWTDSSISKTCNLPEKATVEDVAIFFERLYQKGAKGGTIYRDNCRDQQVIMNTKDSRITHNKENIKRVDYRTAPPLIGRPSWTVCISTAMGKMYVTISFFKGPYEIFVLVGKAGSELYAHCEALGRTMSLFLQLSSHVKPVDRLRILLKNLKDVGGINITGFGETRIKSIPDGVSKAIELFLRQYPNGVIEETDKNIIETEVIKENGNFKTTSMDICPSCRSFTLIHESGCEHCQCGYSKC